MAHKHPDSELSPEEKALAHAVDEEVHVPRGQSRARFLLILGLLIFMTIIYVVPSQFSALFSPDSPAESAYMSWTHPTLGEQQLSARDFMFQRRRYDDFFRTINGGKEARALLDKDEQIARLMILDQLAREAGIEVTDKEIRTTVRDGGFLLLAKSKDMPAGMLPEFFFQLPAFSDSATYTQALSMSGQSANDFQETLRSLLRVQRFEAMLRVVAQPDPAAIEKAWKEQHQEHQFDVVALDVEAARTDAAAQLPDDAALSAWYDALDASLKRNLFSAEWKPERASAELFVWQNGQPIPEALLAAYPRPEGADLEQIAKDYYNQFAHLRFRREAEKADAANDYDRLYMSFDEVADQARAESKLHGALVDLQNAIQARFKAGELVDLAAEAAAVGLQFTHVSEPRTRAEWGSDPSLGDPNLGDAVLRASRTDKFVPLVVGPKQFVFGRALERIESGPPPFAEVREKCVAEWQSQQAQTLVRTKAEALVELMKALDPTTAPAPEAKPLIKVDAATFAAKVQGAGYTLVSTGWIDAGRLPETLPAAPTEADRFAYELSRSAREALGTELDVVSGPLMSSDKVRAFVVRHAAKRDPETVAILPKEYDGLQRSSTYERFRELREGLIEPKGLEQKYKLAFPGRKPESDPVAPPAKS